MNPRCSNCPLPKDRPCLALQDICDRMGDPEMRSRYAAYADDYWTAHRSMIEAARAAAAVANDPPVGFPGVSLGGCCSG